MKMNSATDRTPGAIATVLTLPELVRMIMEQLPPNELLHARHISRTFMDVAHQLAGLRKKLFLTPVHDSKQAHNKPSFNLAAYALGKQSVPFVDSQWMPLLNPHLFGPSGAKKHFHIRSTLPDAQVVTRADVVFSAEEENNLFAKQEEGTLPVIWLKMFLTQPPVTEAVVELRFGLSSRATAEIKSGEGITAETVWQTMKDMEKSGNDLKAVEQAHLSFFEPVKVKYGSGEWTLPGLNDFGDGTIESQDEEMQDVGKDDGEGVEVGEEEDIDVDDGDQGDPALPPMQISYTAWW